MYIQPTDAPLFAFAGLWETWRATGSEERDLPPLHTCTILTTIPNALMRPIHDRMPVILPPDRWTEWLNTTQDLVPTDKTATEAPAYFAPYPAETMRAHEVSARVNSPHHDTPDCIQPHSQMELF